MRFDRLHPRSAILATVLLLGSAAGASAEYGRPVDWQMGMQDMASNLGQSVASFHDWVTLLMGAVVLFVLGLIVAVAVKFNENANPTPSRTTHHTMLEIAWTVVPVLILVAISIPSFRILREQLIIPQADVTLKVIGHAWYWEYEYPAAQAGLPADQGGFKFDSNLVEGNDLKPGMIKLLSVDNEAVVPINKKVRVQVTSADVLHSFAMPSFGFKVDAVPGRLNEMWFEANREGVYYGQCSELCGTRHAYMPIAIRVVSEEQYGVWLGEAKQKYARTGGSEFAQKSAPSTVPARSAPAATSVAAAN